MPLVAPSLRSRRHGPRLAYFSGLGLGPILSAVRRSVACTPRRLALERRAVKRIAHDIYPDIRSEEVGHDLRSRDSTR